MPNKLKYIIAVVMMAFTVDVIYANAYVAVGNYVYYELISDDECVLNCNLAPTVNHGKAKGDIVVLSELKSGDKTYKVVGIADYGFQDCTGVTSVTIPNSVKWIGKNAFQNCSGLNSIELPNSVTSIGDGAFLGTSLRSVKLSDSLESIGAEAFKGCFNGAKTITIPKSCKHIGRSAFAYCNNLFINYNAEDCTIDGFQDTNKGDGGNYIDFRSIHWLYNTTLWEINIGETVKRIPDYLCYQCNILSSVTIPNSVISIGDYAFAYCNGIKSLTISNSMTSIGEKAFISCSGIESLTIPNSVTSIGDGAFYCCTQMASVSISNSLTSISNEMFYDCNALTSVTIPSSVKTIGESAFINCESLKSIKMGDGIQKIGDFAFYGCTGVTEITIDAVVPPVCENGALSGSNCIDKSVCYLYVPDASIDAYKKADQWKEFYNISDAEQIGVDNKSAMPCAVYNLSGIKVIENTFKSDAVKFLSNGVYILKYENGIVEKVYVK